MKKLLILWLAPVLLALFPTLTTYHHNLDQLAFNRLTIPLVYSLGFVLVSGAVALAVFKSQRKASLFTSLWIVLFFSFGYLYLKLGETHLVQLLPVSLNTLLIGLFGLILLGVGMALFKKEPAKKLSNFVLIVGLTTVALNLWTILPFELQRQLAETRLQKYLLLNPMLPSSVEEPALKPDVYYFIFDRYARQDVLAEYFHFDNQETLQALAQNNFFIGTQSFANYPNTYLSLASSLNLRYLDFLPQTLGVKNRDRIPAYQQLIQSNELVRFLKKQGYHYVLAGSFWDPSKTSPLADANYNLFADFDEFELFMYERTLWNTLRGVLENKQLYTGVERLERMAQNFDLRLTSLKKQAGVNSPKFVLAHFLMPHDPNIFDQTCLPMEFAEMRQLTLMEGFLAETQCANKLMLELANYLQTNAKRPTVIIFQSDEGAYLPEQYFNQNEELVPDDPTAYRIHAAILNAIYLPDKEKPTQAADYQAIGLDERSTPINTFRAILNYYFGTNLPILENKVYVFASPDEPYNFREITDRL